MSPGELIARDAGFLKAGEMTTATEPSKVGEFGGMDIVSSPIMPKDWFALRTERGALCVGPKGSFYVPFYNSIKEQG